MRNLTIYLVLLLCLFASKMLAQETYLQASEKYSIKYEKIRQEEGKIYNEEVNKLKIQRRNRIISRQEFKDQKIVLEKKKESNIRERVRLNGEKLWGQFPEMGAKTFEGRAFWISNGIKRDVREEKELLKTEIEAVDKQLLEGVITKSQAEEQKLKLAEARAKAIEEKVKVRQEALKKLVQDDVDNDLKVHEKLRFRLTFNGNNDSKVNIGERYDFVLPAMKNYKGQKDKGRQQNKRTSSQLVVAIGVNNVVTQGAIANSDFKYRQSRFYEWGVTYNSRIVPNHNLLHAKYGLSLMYNDLKPTDNSVFVDKGRQTVLEINPLEHDDSRFRNVNLVVPLHLEFDFTKPKIKNDKTYFKSHNSFRLGIGGYVGTNLKSKQTIRYDFDGYKTVDKTRGDFNTSNFIYGLSTYVGYRATSLYLKYDLNPLFKDNSVKQNNVSLGLRFDFN